MTRGAPAAAVLLDTCAVIWLANGDAMTAAAVEAIDAAGRSGGVFVSAVSAWEVGWLSRPGKRRSMLRFVPDVRTWFGRVMSAPGIRAALFTPKVAIEASFLPGELHGDPADRLIISTARQLGVPLVTRDRKIVDYGAAGHLAVIPC